eukprot:723685-Pyramimonas_sp.AAC.1
MRPPSSPSSLRCTFWLDLARLAARRGASGAAVEEKTQGAARAGAKIAKACEGKTIDEKMGIFRGLVCFFACHGFWLEEVAACMPTFFASSLRGAIWSAGVCMYSSDAEKNGQVRWLCTWVCKTTLAKMHGQLVNVRRRQRLGEGAGAERIACTATSAHGSMENVNLVKQIFSESEMKCVGPPSDRVESRSRPLDGSVCAEM